MTLFDVVFSGADTVYGLAEGAINAAIEKHGADKEVSFPGTAYCLPCYYAVTGTKVTNLGELKEALGVVKGLETKNVKLNAQILMREPDVPDISPTQSSVSWACRL